MAQKRGQFTFYESFAVALKRIRKTSERCAAYDAIVNYALYGEEPEPDRLSSPAAIAFDLIRPHLDTSRRKAEAGMKGSPSGGSEKNRESADKDGGKIDKRSRKDPVNKKETEYNSEKENKLENKSESESELESEKKPAWKDDTRLWLEAESRRTGLSVMRPSGI